MYSPHAGRRFLDASTTSLSAHVYESSASNDFKEIFAL